MKNFIEKTYFLSASDANAEGLLSYTSLTANIIDIATMHANELGIGNATMKEMNAGWILSRLTIEMNRLPEVNSHYIIKTWMEDFNRHFSTRCFKIYSPDGFVYGYSRSIWVVIETIEHKNIGLSHFNMPKENILGESIPIPRQEKHFLIKEKENNEGHGVVSTAEPYFYKFQYCDLDYYRHVNTVRYVSLLMNQFTLQEHDETFVSRIELSFLHEASYAMATKLLRYEDPDNPLVTSFQLSDFANGNALLFARVKRDLYNA